jgi:hypothetical protein
MTAMTASALVTAGYRDAQKLARGATLPADLLAEGIERLNDLINLWQTQGLKLFLESETDVPLVAGQQRYTFGPGGNIDMQKPLRIKEAAYWDEFDNSRPIFPISRQEWTSLTTRTAIGSINQYFVEKGAQILSLYLWQIPGPNEAKGKVKVVLHNSQRNVAVGADTVGWPIEWGLALRWGIADEVSFGMPEAVQQRCQQRAQAYRQALEDWDVEDAETYFQPDHRTLAASRFR